MSESIPSQNFEGRERRPNKMSPEMMLAGTIINLKRRYAAVVEKYPPLFDGTLDWDLSYTMSEDKQSIASNPEDVADFSALVAIEAQAQPTLHEKELEELILKILKRKIDRGSLWKRVRGSLRG